MPGRGTAKVAVMVATPNGSGSTRQTKHEKVQKTMGLTKLENNAALVVIDLQKGMLSAPTVHPLDEIVRNAANLAAAFRRQGHPVMLVNVAGGAPRRTEITRPVITRTPDWTDLVDELDVQPEDHLVTKMRWGAFYGTSLDAQLKELGVTQVVLAGVSTSAGVESTARSAHEHGYHVVLVKDAMTDRDAEAHRNSIERIFPKLGETTTTTEVLAMLGAPGA